MQRDVLAYCKEPKQITDEQVSPVLWGGHLPLTQGTSRITRDVSGHL